MSQLQRLLKDKAGLGHGSLGRVHQQKNAVHHLEDPLHLASEVGVPGRIDNVDLDILIVYRGILCQNGDAPFPLQVVGVHHPFLNHLIFPESAALLEHLVHQSGLAMVNVGDNSHVAQIVSNQV